MPLSNHCTHPGKRLADTIVSISTAHSHIIRDIDKDPAKIGER
jgi:hypothetical protein